jgi:hypothetical protein
MNAARKALIADYKDRPTVAGIYAVICSATGQVWVGQSRHIDTQQNGLWFALKSGGGRDPSLQAAWNAHSPEDFRFEQLDRLPTDLSDMRRKDELKERAARWMQRLQAEALLPG